MHGVWCAPTEFGVPISFGGSASDKDIHVCTLNET